MKDDIRMVNLVIISLGLFLTKCIIIYVITKGGSDLTVSVMVLM